MGLATGTLGTPARLILAYVDYASPLTCNRRVIAGDKRPQFLENAFLKKDSFLVKSLLCSKTNRKAILLKTKNDFIKNQNNFRKPFGAQPPPSCLTSATIVKGLWNLAFSAFGSLRRP